MRLPGFIGPSYTLSSVNVECQRCVNMFPEIDEAGTGKDGEVASLASTPGLVSFATSSFGGAVRCLYRASNGTFYAAIGARLFSVSSAGVLTSLHTLLTSSGVVSMADNGTTLATVDGVNGYATTMSTGVTVTITDPDWHGANFVQFQDGYFIFNWPATGKFYISSLYGTDIDPLDFATAESSPDPIVGLLSDHRELWLFGSQSTEVWFNSGNADFPFSRIEGAKLEHGCASGASVAKLNNTVFWLGIDERGAGLVWMAEGHAPQRVSTQAIERVLQQLTETQLSGATAYTYQSNGHGFYVLNVPGLTSTWVYDVSTRLWHERDYTESDTTRTRHRGEWHAFVFGKHFVGDYETATIYEFSDTTYTDAGAIITRERITPHVSNGLKRVFHRAAQLDMETGVGIDGAGQGDDPQVMLRWSDNGGHSWGNEHWMSIGKIGERTKRPIWRRLGCPRDRVYHVKITDPVKVRLLGFELDVEAGAS